MVFPLSPVSLELLLLPPTAQLTCVAGAGLQALVRGGIPATAWSKPVKSVINTPTQPWSDVLASKTAHGNSHCSAQQQPHGQHSCRWLSTRAQQAACISSILQPLRRCTHACGAVQHPWTQQHCIQPRMGSTCGSSSRGSSGGRWQVHPQPGTHRSFAQFRAAGSPVEPPKPKSLDDLVRRHSLNLQRGFMVVELYPNGATMDQHLPVSHKELGIAFRDTSLFSSENSFTDQKPCILVRQNCILFKSDAIRAVIHKHKAYIFKNKPNRNYSNLLVPLVSTLRPENRLSAADAAAITSFIDMDVPRDVSSQVEAGAAHQLHGPGSHHPHDRDIPFELNVLEGMLFISCSWFDTRMRHLKSIMEGLMRDVNDASEPFAAVYNEALIQQVAPLDKAITSLRNGARDTREAVRQVLDDEEMMQDICLTQKILDARHTLEMEKQLGDSGCYFDHRVMSGTPSKHPERGYDYESPVEQARRMLESYDRELDAIAGMLDEMRENLDTVRDSWSMKLDSARNHIILLNLKMTLASLCLMTATMLPSWGGMNIEHGMPDQPWVFWAVVATSCMVGVAMYPVSTHMYRHNWKLRSRRDMLRFHSIRAFLVEHLDDLDDVVCAVRKIRGKLSREQFEKYMREQMPEAQWKNASLDFLFHQYDTNKDGFLEGIEVAQRTADEYKRELEHLPDHLTRSLHLEQMYDEARDEPQTWLDWVRRKMGLKHGESIWERIMYGSAATHPLIEQRSGGRIVRH